jgi:hypothetical protein
MVLGLWHSAKANKENIFYTILTIFLLERVRRGWNRIESRGRAANLPSDVIERRQQWFAFRAALLYALPFLLPTVKYVYRSADELSQYVGGLGVLSSPWALVVVGLVVEAFLAVLLFNLLGIYVERMNAALGFFRKMGRSVVDGSRLAVSAGRARVHAGASAGVRAGESVGRSIRQGATMVGAGLLEGGRRGVGYSLSLARRAPGRMRRLVASQLAVFK